MHNKPTADFQPLAICVRLGHLVAIVKERKCVRLGHPSHDFPERIVQDGLAIEMHAIRPCHDYLALALVYVVERVDLTTPHLGYDSQIESRQSIERTSFHDVYP